MPRVVASIPSEVTEVEKRAVVNAVSSIGVRKVYLIEAPKAAAMGCSLDITSPHGILIADVGSGTADIAVLSLGGIACCNSIKVGGEAMDDSIVTYMRKTHNLLIGERTAEDIKLKIGSALEYDGEAAMEVRGRNLTDGLPGSVEITSSDIREVLQEPVGQILTAVKETLEVTLPELSADIIDRGIYLTGGASRLRGLRDLIENEIKIPIIVPENSTDCVALGTSIKLRRAK